MSAAVSDAPGIETTRKAVNAVVCMQHSFDDAIASGAITGNGIDALREIAGLLEPIARSFEIVEPRRSA